MRVWEELKAGIEWKTSSVTGFELVNAFEQRNPPTCQSVSFGLCPLKPTTLHNPVTSNNTLCPTHDEKGVLHIKYISHICLDHFFSLFAYFYPWSQQTKGRKRAEAGCCFVTRLTQTDTHTYRKLKKSSFHLSCMSQECDRKKQMIKYKPPWGQTTSLTEVNWNEQKWTAWPLSRSFHSCCCCCCCF